ncbi:unnamed protein product, partial [Vitis vinifera]
MSAVRFFQVSLSWKLLSACALLSRSSYSTLTSMSHLLFNSLSLVERHPLLVTPALFRSKLLD